MTTRFEHARALAPVHLGLGRSLDFITPAMMTHPVANHARLQREEAERFIENAAAAGVPRIVAMSLMHRELLRRAQASPVPAPAFFDDLADERPRHLRTNKHETAVVEDADHDRFHPDDLLEP